MTKGYGLTVDDIDWSAPADLEPYAKAYRLEMTERDGWAYTICGNYVLSAVSVAVEHCLAGKKARSRYVEKPMLQELEEKNKPMTEEELQRQRELFVAKLEVMKTNFELNHGKGGGE